MTYKIICYVVALSMGLNIFLFGFAVGPLQFATVEVKAQEGGKITEKLHVPAGLHAQVIKTDEESKIVIKDYTGSSRVVNKDGVSVEYQNYYSFGEEVEQEKISTDTRYAGHRGLEGTNVSHIRARFYSPRAGVFIQPDDYMGPNRYVYADNNPILFGDKSGKDKVDMTVSGGGLAVSAKSIRATGTIDPYVMDQSISSGLVSVVAAATGAAAIPVAAAYAPTVLTICLGNPAACTGIGTEVAATAGELATGAELPVVGVGDLPYAKFGRKLDKAVDASGDPLTAAANDFRKDRGVRGYLMTPKQVRQTKNRAGKHLKGRNVTVYRPDDHGVNAGVIYHETGHALMHNSWYRRIKGEPLVDTLFNHLQEIEALDFEIARVTNSGLPITGANAKRLEWARKLRIEHEQKAISTMAQVVVDFRKRGFEDSMTFVNLIDQDNVRYETLDAIWKSTQGQ